MVVILRFHEPYGQICKRDITEFLQTNAHDDKSVDELLQILREKDTIIMYSKQGCVYCEKAKQLLKNKHIKFLNKTITSEVKNKMIPYTNHTSFPVIFKGEHLIGGFEELESSEI